MMRPCILGVDTSNYTTSLGLVTPEGELLANIKRPLPVAEGERGLRQSDALFAHIKNIPSAMSELREQLSDKTIVAVGVSSRPRNANGSYMPCFLAGVSVAESVSAATGAPLYTFSHQCGHMMAAILSADRHDLLSRPFCAFHVSGGTTDMLSVEYRDGGFLTERIGGTKDLNAGQVIDRIGVMLGLRFPCGPALEELATKNTKKIPRKQIASDGLSVNLSGLENMATTLYLQTKDAPLTAAFVLDYIGNALLRMAEGFRARYGERPYLFAGGVMSNSQIKAKLSSRLSASFATPALSSDNAVGIAALAALAYQKEGGKGWT